MRGLISHLSCPNCGARDNNAIDSRPAGEGHAIRRRRHCNACGKRFTTYEAIGNPATRADLQKIANGLHEAWHRITTLLGSVKGAKS